ncbi:MAG TPA: hypothetical protein VFC78_16805 [Tepidisphaeraceae bacterium]|nr:hypothetical protein [Tepidisphaeraceae bacterium]
MEMADSCFARRTRWDWWFPLIVAAIASIVSGCCIWKSRDVSSDPNMSFNFTQLLKAKCFKTKGVSLFSLGSYLYPVGPGTGLDVHPNHLEPGDALLPAGTRFRVIRMVEHCGDTGGTYVEATILNGRMAGQTVDVKGFFLPKSVGEPGESANGFIIGPHVVACDDHP